METASAKRGRGRPPKLASGELLVVRASIKLTAEERLAIDKLGRSTGEYIADLVREHLDRDFSLYFDHRPLTPLRGLGTAVKDVSALLRKRDVPAVTESDLRAVLVAHLAAGRALLESGLVKERVRPLHSRPVRGEQTCVRITERDDGRMRAIAKQFKVRRSTLLRDIVCGDLDARLGLAVATELRRQRNLIALVASIANETRKAVSVDSRHAVASSLKAWDEILRECGRRQYSGAAAAALAEARTPAFTSPHRRAAPSSAAAQGWQHDR